MEDALKSVEEFFNHKGVDSVNSPRTRSITEGSALNVMHASHPYLGRAGVKAYLGTRRGTKFLFLLFDLNDGALLAAMGADFLGRYRTGAASGVATKHLCGLKSFKLGIAGTGTQAATQVEALAKVANLERVSVWSPTRSSREHFAQSIAGKLGIDCRASESLTEALKRCEVATTVTSATKPFVTRESLQDVMHVNACGSNSEKRAELTPEAVSLFSTVCVDDLVQSRVESGDLIQAASAGAFKWEIVVELGQVVRNGFRRRGKTLFKSNGIAGEDVALASLLYDRAVRKGGYASSFDFSQ
jgi:ornithine cyclodeaminase/alanine dehydrogenase-like protein (mu-crystallin family)